MATSANEVVPTQPEKPKPSQKSKKKTAKTTPSNNNETTQPANTPAPTTNPSAPKKNKKNKKKSNNKKTGPKDKSTQTYKSYDMFPLLHSAVTSAISSTLPNPPTFHSENSSRNCEKDYNTNIMGSFICHNGSCPNDGWSSKVVAIVIRLYAGNKYNAVVYNQRCRRCNQLGKLTLDKTSYVERVAYRLQKWGGVRDLETPVFVEKKTDPHESALCEGCKNGVCPKSVSRS